ncbi:M20/M25/M40 family metallo-hydrolase [Shewanella electrodiphila]|uniref:M20/M25/M40 family metallo-hydrolase n=1 Tax=Shewanella electrodiphila TaxID=934143 RepID=A0ABT0KRI1_9GAMM|nr:M20/M25/M40 family metallo-hydrolase [Shewanella electrodiphila]MCL1046399.1 M20/M25/M40 family metallo-hydrolase [Shewanella electrodiphila]
MEFQLKALILKALILKGLSLKALNLKTLSLNALSLKPLSPSVGKNNELVRHGQALHSQLVNQTFSSAISSFNAHALSVLLLCLFLSGCASQNCGNSPVNHWSNQSQLLEDIRVLSSPKFEGRKTGTYGADLSREYIKQRFTELNLTPWQDEFEVPFNYRSNFSDKQGINLIATIEASNNSQRWRVITAHYDHLGKKGNKVFAGADDNASGVAAMLAIAEQWQQQENDNINLMIVATDAEEPGLYGSYALVEQLTSTPDMQLEMSLNLDMIGNPSRPHAIYIEGEKNLSEFSQLKTQLQDYNQLCIRQSRSRMKNGSMVKIDWLRASDHYPFHKMGIPWLYLGVPTHKQYHTINDTIDTINIGFLAAVTETAFELVSVNKQQIAFQ